MAVAYVSSPGALSTWETFHKPVAAVTLAYQWGNGGGTYDLAQWTSNGDLVSGVDKTAVGGQYAFDGRAGIQTRSDLITAGDVYFNLRLDKIHNFDCISILNHNWDDNDFFEKQIFEIRGDTGGWVQIYDRAVVPAAAWANANIHLWNFRGDNARSDLTKGAGLCQNAKELRIRFKNRSGANAVSHAPAMGEIFVGRRYDPPFEPSYPFDGGMPQDSGSDMYRMNWQDGMVDRMEMHNGDVKNYIRYQGRARREFAFTWFDGADGSTSQFWTNFWNFTNGGTMPFMWQDASFHSAKFDRLPMLMLLDEPAWISPLSQHGTRKVEMAFSELPPFRQNSNCIIPGKDVTGGTVVFYNGSGTYT